VASVASVASVAVGVLTLPEEKIKREPAVLLYARDDQ
jgi:hypothetical protein